MHFKLATWNVNSLRVRLPHLFDWLNDQQPDVVGLQETKTINENFPIEEIREQGYDAIYNGQKTYNGVAFIYKQSLTPENTLNDFPDYDDPQRRFIATTLGNVRLINVYIPNGAEVGSDKFEYKLEWLDVLNHFISQELQQYKQLIVMGDFNIAPEDRDVYDPIAWQGSVLVSPIERKRFQQLLDLGLLDSFRLFEQPDNSYSWWDYRAAAFRRNMGLRIDHILISKQLKANFMHCWIDKTPRQRERPSDHTPVVLELNLD